MSSLCELLVKTIKNEKKYSYDFLESVLRIIDIDLNNLNKYDIKNNVNIFRRKLGNELIKNNLYKILPNKLKSNKNSIHLILINNDLCDENIYKYVSYYLELNIFIIFKNTYRCVNTYDPEINSIILVEDEITKFTPVYVNYKNEICNIYNNSLIDELLENFTINKKLIFNDKLDVTNDTLKEINKLKNNKLCELKELCNIYNINTNDKIYKKIDLFTELKNKIINDIKLI